MLRYSVEDLEKVAMTIKASKVPTQVTGHSGARTTTYINSSANAAVSDEEMTGAETNEHWYFASAIDVLADKDHSVIACLGDSITDGRGCTTNANNRWTDVFMERLKAAGMNYTVVNDGIGGNAINTRGLGEAGIYRFRNEVINRKGLKYIIVLEGINDIGGKTAETDSIPVRSAIRQWARLLSLVYLNKSLFSENNGTLRCAVILSVKTRTACAALIIYYS